ncbi:uncharacterized protein LOC107612543 [Arachis ipaensis]|uniref:uncharacterized protein LOC107612543 n=1 Tax=Arachis ipaensis TaxID=130454 RepID=UPI000A2B6672|nr:uncharacterized protein LOC107612543 [Arachis ipaensis]
MALKTCFTLLHHSQHSSSRIFFSIPFFNSATCILHNEPHNNHILHFSTFFTKRKLNLALLLTTFLSSNLSNTSGALLMAQELDLELHRYTDSKEGFTLLIPSSWTKVDKAGATALFQDASMGSNNIGVVVNPVRLANLGDFGSPEFVADKLLQAERCKETKKEEEEIGNQERRRRRMSDEQSDSAMMNPWDISDPCDMIDFYADEPPQFQFESPPLPEPVWNGDENNVGDPQPQPCAMDVSVNQPPQPVIDDGFPEAMKRTEHSWGSPSSGYQPHQSQPQSCAIDVCGNQPPQLPSQPPQLPPQPQPQPCLGLGLGLGFFLSLGLSLRRI